MTNHVHPTPNHPREVVIIGSGFGGLSTACYLANEGFDVTVVEKNEQLGGRASVFSQDGFHFDMGPSWYLMPDVFERFFGHFNRRPADYYQLEHLDPHYRVLWKDGDQMNITPDKHHVKTTFESYESGASDAFDRYLENAKETYEIGMEHFVYTDRSRFRDYLDWDVIRHANGLSLLNSMQDHVESYFDHPKLQQVMQYSLVFLGGAPQTTPALYNLMSHVDFNLGVHYPKGGMGVVADAIVDLGKELGVTYRTDLAVTKIRGERDNFRIETPGETIHTDLVVSNADYAHTEQDLLAPENRQYDADYWESKTYAPSAFLMYLGVEGEVEPLAHHNLVLPTNWDEHFEQIFDRPRWPDNPAYYVCVPSKTDDSVAPHGHSNLFVLVPIAPGLDDSVEQREAYRDLILTDITDNTGVDLTDKIVVEKHFAVSDFAERYNSQNGTALGLAHTLRQTGPMRPRHRSKTMDGLYYTGAYTTPGIGVPMCLISGEHTAATLIEHEDKKPISA